MPGVGVVDQSQKVSKLVDPRRVSYLLSRTCESREIQ